MNKQERARKILTTLKRHYKKTGPFLNWKNPLELLMGTILSAQCTDEQVNKVTAKLFKKYKTAGDYAKANLRTIEKEVYATGFYKSKARYLKETGKILEKDFRGRVPDSLEDLLTLKGVAHKVAYLILSKAYGKNAGVAVDTHVLRLAPRLGLVNEGDAQQKMSEKLMDLYQPKDYLFINEYLITHGRAVCSPGIPKCEECILVKLCPSSKKFLTQRKK